MNIDEWHKGFESAVYYLTETMCPREARVLLRASLGQCNECYTDDWDNCKLKLLYDRIKMPKKDHHLREFCPYF